MFKVDLVSGPVLENVNGFENVVRKINWLYESLGDDFNHYVHGPAIELTPPSPGQSFIPFLSLTEEQINSWIESTLTDEEKQFYISKDSEVREQVAKEKDKVDEGISGCYGDAFDHADRHSWAFYAKTKVESYPWVQTISDHN